jgi:ferric-dicitrate binding protein FerR (iron transport regulator)
MSDDASEVRRLLGALRDRPVSVDQERLAARRARVVSSLKHDVRALAAARVSRARRRSAYIAFSLVAAAGVLLAVHRFGQPSFMGPALTITFVGSVGQTTARSGVTERTLRAGEALRQDPGEIESAAEGSAELVTSAGLGLKLGGATRVSLAGLPALNQVELSQGLLTCSVPHLSEGQRFSVQTPDARVVVHGTVFSVQVDSKRGLGAATCVEVTDGVVIVQHLGGETALNAGDSWGCGASVSAEGSANPVPAATPAKGTDVSDRHSVPRSGARRAEPSTLGEESRLLQEALAAERVGQPERAQGLLNQLLARYPKSPLAPEARRASSRIASASAGK